MNNRQPPQFPDAHNFDLGYDPDENQGHQHPPSHHPAHLAQARQDPDAWQYSQYIPSVTPTASSSYGWSQLHPAYVPLPSSNADATHAIQQQYFQQPFSSAVAYNTPGSEGYYLGPSAAPPYAYHAAPQFSGYPSPVSRSMSVSAVSSTSIDQAAPGSLAQHPQQQQQPSQTNTFLPTPRQIRFVSTDGQPHAKRRRINAACLTCRKRKTRCSGEKPVCRTCSDNGHKCAGYAEKTQKKEGDKSQHDGNDEDDDESRSSSPKYQLESLQKNITRQPQAAPGNDERFDNHRPNTIDSRTRFTARDQSFEGQSPISNFTAGSGSAVVSRARVPYFRYFGPTAIVPGFKQMVVQMKDGRDHRRNHLSFSSDSSVSAPVADGGVVQRPLSPVLIELPYYDATSPEPNAPLITSLCETFFVALGCNYPFLQRAGFLRDLEEKRVDAILVNAVCAVSARFSADPILARPSDEALPLDNVGNVKRAFRGQPFAQRAMSALIHTFPCPTLAVTQACLLLAYEEFGADRDSGLWMYLGTSIRMAQDLGIQKLEGLQLAGRIGPTPKTVKHGKDGKEEENRRAEQQRNLSRSLNHKDEYQDRKASEQERIDTFWSIFFLDRAVSSGVGRPVTLRDKDIEISFPYKVDETIVARYPDPFPAMIRIVHMYGRVADVLNNIRELSEVTPEVLARLADMEKGLTGIYQKLSPRLHFNATNFQHYVKAEQGTNFILLHFWFHTLIVLLHQPTLLHSFEGQIQQLFQDSRELSMSSAKTIADILAFAELIDVKTFVGNPFTSQPMYVAACAFLAEAVAHASQPPSRRDSPFEEVRNGTSSQDQKDAEQKLATKHSLLASAANQNYQRCYQALKTLDSYWAGCRYILTALDQKAKGLMDPLLFTSEDVDEMPSTEPSFTSPGWRRSSFAHSLGGPELEKQRRSTSQERSWSQNLDFGNAIGWSITGTANSPAPQMSFLYQNANGEDPRMLQNSAQPPPKTGQAGQVAAQTHPNDQVYNTSTQNFHSRPRTTSLPYDPVSTAEADLLLALHSPYSISSGTTAAPNHTRMQQNFTQPMTVSQPNSEFPDNASQYNNFFIETQDIDISNQNNFNLGNLNFPGGDMIPWLEYLPRDVLDYFGDTNDAGQPDIHRNSSSGGLVPPSGPGPPQHHYNIDPGGRTSGAHQNNTQTHRR